MNLDRDIELLYEVGSMRHIERTWRQFGGINFANVAEHTLRVIWIALILAKHEQADISKVIQLALVHDLPETRTGDVNYVLTMYTDRKEEEALEDTLYGTSVNEEIRSLWLEYEKKDTLEAHIVKDSDTLDCDLELLERAANGSSIGESLRVTRERAYAKLYTNTAKNIFKAIQSSDPQSWHLNARNRLTAGDWKKTN